MNSPINKHLIAILLGLLALSGCARDSHNKKPASAHTAAEPLPAQPSFVGTVTLVNEELRFVLIEASTSSMPGPGQALKCISNGVESAIIAVGAESRRPFISADIVKGTPHQGDEVYQ